jgi:hypothetical protein
MLFLFKKIFSMNEQLKNHNNEEKKADRETILKERHARRREEERLRKLNRNEWEKEYDDYLDWHEKEEAREEMMKRIDSMLLKPTEKNI